MAGEQDAQGNNSYGFGFYHDERDPDHVMLLCAGHAQEFQGKGWRLGAGKLAIDVERPRYCAACVDAYRQQQCRAAELASGGKGFWVDVPSPEIAWALAQFTKRIGWAEIRGNAVNDDEAYQMRDGLQSVSAALARVGHAPR